MKGISIAKPFSAPLAYWYDYFIGEAVTKFVADDLEDDFASTIPPNSRVLDMTGNVVCGLSLG